MIDYIPIMDLVNDCQPILIFSSMDGLRPLGANKVHIDDRGTNDETSQHFFAALSHWFSLDLGGVLIFK